MKNSLLIQIITGMLIGGILCFLLGTMTVTARSPNECVQLTYHRIMICEWPFGSFTNYTAGEGDVVLAGNVPHDNSWNNQYFRLSGNLVNNGSCTMLVVDKAISCSSVDVK